MSNKKSIPVTQRWADDDIDPSAITVENVKQNLFIHGGPGSGHFGHEGRPGLVGGSSSDELPSQEKILSEAERDYYWNTKSGGWVESPYDPETFKDLKREDLLKMEPEHVVTVKTYTARRGGVSRKKIKVKYLLLDNPGE